MKFRYSLTRSARRDLQQISDYWAAEAGEEVALRIVAAILETVITLSGLPMAGVAAEQFGVSVRKFPAGNYMIYYRTGRSRCIQILHVFHGARQQSKAWEDEALH
jgi:plasmid stabilization system protein ParE